MKTSFAREGCENEPVKKRINNKQLKRLNTLIEWKVRDQWEKWHRERENWENQKIRWKDTAQQEDSIDATSYKA
jgi:hypothetical protein